MIEEKDGEEYEVHLIREGAVNDESLQDSASLVSFLGVVRRSFKPRSIVKISEIYPLVSVSFTIVEIMRL